jgi:NAD-dependent deacetylase
MDFPTGLLDKICNSKQLLFFTGAGVSAESGIDTFRGAGGLWKKYKAADLATPEAFERNPNLVWEWYQHRRKIVRAAEPNMGHYAIAEFEKFFESVSVVTQNIDNLHNRAGSSNVIELHGNIEKNFCSDCGKRFDFITFEETNKVPMCDECAGNIRPDVVWFGEMLPEEAFSLANYKATSSDICFVVGTSAIVYPAAFIPETAKRAGAILVEINIEETNLSSIADFSLIGKSGVILSNLLTEIKNIKRTG